MTRPSDPLKALVLAEQRAVGPTAEAAAACWDSIAADLQRGVLPSLDVPPPPAPPRHGLTWLALTLVGAATLAAGLYSLRGEGEAAARTVPAVAQTEDQPVSKSIVQSSVARADEAATPAILPHEEGAERAAEIAQGRAESPASPAPEEPQVTPEPVSVAPVNPARTRRPAPQEPVSADTFAAELKLLAEGHAALNRGDAAEALRIADLYKKTYPKGHFKEDREALRALAQCVAGGGSAAARSFLVKNPRSIHVTRIREACGLPAAADE